MVWFLFLVVSLLTYLLTKKELTLEEVNGHAIDVVTAGVDTVSIDSRTSLLASLKCLI